MEEWRYIKGYEYIYQISNLGNVRRMDTYISNGQRIILKKGGKKITCLNKRLGYVYVILSKNGIKKSYRLHRLVAEAFVSNPLNKKEVNHINEIKTDNSANNLEWVTSKENANHGTRNERCGLKHRVPIIGTNINTKEVVIFNSFVEAKDNGFCKHAISKCIRKVPKFKTHKGFTWEYLCK